jgi:outer membrane receptor protein involved in Fe transport
MRSIFKFTCMPIVAVLTFSSSIQAAEIEEVIVQGRLLSGAEALVSERMEEEAVIDVIGAEFISRIGDSTVAAALRRVSGLSLVSGKFIYVRGLGERYSSSSLNGATIPSPDLTRNVIPLDLFPTSIVESLKVQKSFSADRPASFGGGSVDIRTKSIPEWLTYSVEFTGGLNSESNGNLLSYSGGDDDAIGTDDGTRSINANLVQGIQRFKGNLDAQNVLNTLRTEGDNTSTLSDAQTISRQLALGLNRNISTRQDDGNPDWGVRASIGNNFILTDEWEAGFLFGGSYGTKWRQTNAIARNFRFPTERFEVESETTQSFDLNTNLNLGIRYTDDHELSSTSLFIRNTDDEVAVIDLFNENRELSDGRGFRNERIKFEERNMIVNQVKATHRLGEATRELLQHVPLVSSLPINRIPEGLQFDWYYSEARAFTDIPNEVNVSSETVTNLVSGGVESASVSMDSAAADYRFTELDDKVINYAGKLTLPISTRNSVIKLSAGWEHTKKLRTYEQTQFSLGALSVNDPALLNGSLGSVFSDQNITDPANNFVFDLTGTNNQSYIAATLTDAMFGHVDWTWDDRWRLSAGARWEDFTQVALDWNIYAFGAAATQVSLDPATLADSVFRSDEIYPSIAMTYMGQWWAEIFQLRLGYSETVVRPDLREITNASYIDARTGFLTDGDSSVRPADLSNIDLRAEWFFDSGDNLTVSLYLKDIDNPIEFFESAASDTNRAREIVNAASGEVRGIEFEGLKNLSGFGGLWEMFFIQGNITIQDSELIAGVNADAPTNPVRRLAGASDYVVNLLLGFDSRNARHSATVTYNVFGERLYAAGRRGAPDAFEQPYHSLDLTYSWYPTEEMTLKLKVQNLLDEAVEIEREGIVVFEEKPGTALAVTYQWAL